MIEGRETILAEIASSPQDLRDYLADAAQALMSKPRFLDVLPGIVLDQERVSLIRDRLARIAKGRS